MHAAHAALVGKPRGAVLVGIGPLGNHPRMRSANEVLLVAQDGACEWGMHHAEALAYAPAVPQVVMLAALACWRSSMLAAPRSSSGWVTSPHPPTHTHRLGWGSSGGWAVVNHLS